MPPGTFALTYTVKNEARLLPSAIEYHLAAGCSRIYLFWDNTTDNASELVAKYPQVIARKSFRPEELENPPLWLARILPAWEPDLDVRKIANTYYATLDAAKSGIEWLINIDADELILMNRSEQDLADHIPRYLARVPENIDQLHLPPLESVPTSSETVNPFLECTYFLNRFPATETVWRYSRAAFVRITRSPRLLAWYDWLFYQVRFAGALQRMMRDPVTKRRIPGTYFLAYANYKSFMRTARATEFEFATHGWRPYLKRPRSLRFGNILHFDMLDYRYFAAKFRQRPPSQDWFYLRYLLSIVARERSLEEVKQFFETYVAIRDPRRITRLKKKGIVVEVTAPSKFLKSLAGKSAPTVEAS
ncbi:MAG TPA: glycosyltransferase family 2 protein [Bryobacteraceae bacterium]|nr:glycosyltransferase family 2 protein [Bryobacteraceae bacterium]